MKNVQKTNTNVKFTKELYVTLSNDITGQIVQTKQDKEDIICKIEGRKERLKELKVSIVKINEEIETLKEQIVNIKVKISSEKILLRNDKKEKFSLSRELVTKKNNNKKLNALYVNGEETIDVSRFFSTKQQKNNTNVKFTKELYINLSNKLTEQIVQTKQDKEDIISKIEGRKEYLKELKALIVKKNEEIAALNEQIRNINLNIVAEKRLLHADKKEKFSLSRQLVTKKNSSKRLNTLYVNGEETIDISRFCPTIKQKTR